ncbi:MAG TPA: long-chain fatty acid--CoA ligase [Candidatus Aminicenantes bacterium]|nr:long-chain fatty acid--CoA ligase [Candidatus Aminicenantes bacterium]HRY64643.1 long-chain fatty acid--CoA ligase [Candidatus Aminicenantes bacterium]HRZ71556.1 long-chain fatty acid--CoA ligase [Candidatus Aminicenantes bacterium]
MPERQIATLSRLFLDSCRTYVKPNRMLVKRDKAWTRISTAEIETTVRRLSLGFMELGLKPGDRVALLSENRPEWVQTDFAVLCAGGVTVPIYTSLLPDQVRYIIGDAAARIAVCSDLEMWRKIQAGRDKLPALERIIVMDGDPPAGTLALSDVEEMGRRLEGENPGRFEQAAAAVRPGDLASIIYTSGTTGAPKRVMLSHANFVANIDSLAEVIDFRESDTALSFLPLSHVFERTATFIFYDVGATIAYAESVEAVASNMPEVRPTVLISVPRFFEKIYARVMDQVMAGSRIKRAIFVWALATGRKHAARMIAGQPIPMHLSFKRAVAKRLVFSKITARTGGRIRYMICGGAALSQDITAFFLAIGLLVLPGYGLTESAPVLTGNTPGRVRLGTSGKAIPRVELRIAEDGEILARGPNIMMGYYRNEADTREVLKDGWLHTGDIGRLDEDGYLIITDRKKDIIVTSGGKNVAPQPIESLILASPFIASAVVVGSSRKFVSALVVPNFEKLEAWARKAGIAVADRAGLSRLPAVAAFLLGEINRMTPGLASYERIKKIAVLDRDFELDLGEVTPTLKVRRNFVERKYADLIESLYQG